MPVCDTCVLVRVRMCVYVCLVLTPSMTCVMVLSAVSPEKVGPIILDPSVGEEVDALVAQEPAVFEGLVRRDVPGESHRVRVEVEREKV